MTLANKLRYLMLLSGVSQIELSNQTKIERSTLTKILNGSTTQPKIDTLYTLAQYFNVAPTEFLDILHNPNLPQVFLPQSKIKDVLAKLMSYYKISNTSILNKKTGIPTNALSDILHGKTLKPKIKTLTILSSFFNVTVPQLYGIDPLPSYNEIVSISNIQQIPIPILNFEQIQYWLNDSKVNEATQSHIVVNIPQTKTLEKTYAIKIKDNKFFPELMPGNILIADKITTPVDGDMVICFVNKKVSVYEYISKSSIKIKVREIGNKKISDFDCLDIIILGTVIQRIINR